MRHLMAPANAALSSLPLLLLQGAVDELHAFAEGVWAEGYLAVDLDDPCARVVDRSGHKFDLDVFGIFGASQQDRPFRAPATAYHGAGA